MTKMKRRAQAAVTAVLLAGAVSLTAQQAPAYRAPRTPDNQPDLQGVWQVLNSAEFDLLDHGASLGVPPGRSVVEGNEIPYQPAARAQKEKNFASRATADPAAKCYYPGVPRITYIPHPFKIVQTKNYVMFLYEFGHHVRLVYTDGSPYHEDIPQWMGDSRGRWEGETFLVESKNFNGETWFDRAGNFHSEALNVVERFTRTGPDHIRYEATITDPKVFTRPWKMAMPIYRRVEPDAGLLEYECFALTVLEGGRYDEMIKNAKPAGQ
jgi:hypothetical protein